MEGSRVSHFVMGLKAEQEFLKSLWGLGTEEEEGYRTGPPGYIGWRSSFLESILGPHTRLKIRGQAHLMGNPI